MPDIPYYAIDKNVRFGCGSFVFTAAWYFEKKSRK